MEMKTSTIVFHERRRWLLLGLLPLLYLLGALPARAATDFYTVPPCRILDTRNTAGPLGGPDLPAGGSRAFAIAGQCGISTSAQAIMANVTVTPIANGNLAFGPVGAAKPTTSTINFRAGLTRANNAILPLGTAGGLIAWSNTTADARVIVDVTGYFSDAAVEASTTSPVAFNPPPATYPGDQVINLVSTTPGAQIRYTTDGSTPTTTTGTLYSGPFTITSTTTLRAIAYKSGLANSSVTQGTYSVSRQDMLLLAVLTPQGSAVSLGSGRASLLLAANEQTAVLRQTWSNLSSTLTGSHIHAPDGQIIFDIDDATPAADGSLTWTIVSTGAWTREQILAALRAGQCYLNLHTANYPSGEIKGFFRPANGSITFTPPPAPPAAPTGPANDADAARFLTQATYGPTVSTIATLRSMGTYSAWIENQFTRPIATHLSYVDTLLAIPNHEDYYHWHGRESIWKQAIQGQDQLRQRVALALSEIFVVSSVDDDLNGIEAVPSYMDVLNRNAFGNFRTLLQDVTLSPAMGGYLDMLSNDKEDPETGQNPNENFGREILQLFSIGLYQLHPDGTLKLDTLGLPIETYNQDVIKGFAKVFTGWTYANQDHNVDWRFYWPEQDFRHPMEIWPEHHSTGTKLLLNGVTLPANQAAQTDLSAALDNIFLHPNAGPFLCRGLIQRLVTSNPSPGYVYRCGQAFENNGQGVRGDMKAVIRAILLDWEARSPDVLGQPGYGKVKEPVLRFVSILRALNAQPPTDGRFRYYWQMTAEWGLNQAPLHPDTVFNFFDPAYSQPGEIAEAGLASPELQIINETSVFGSSNFLAGVIFEGYADDNTNITLDYSYLTGAPNDSVRLDRINQLFFAGQMTADTRTILANALASPYFPTDPVERAQTLVRLVSLSPEFLVQR
jgi:uncharacterized protein (DUF1800 family)